MTWNLRERKTSGVTYGYVAKSSVLTDRKKERKKERKNNVNILFANFVGFAE